MFVESSLIEACKAGNWVLLDEANLAPADVLQRLISVLCDDRTDDVSLTDLGGPDRIKKHRDFRLFAAINPATDTGKRPLPPIVSEKFIPITVPELEQSFDLIPIVTRSLKHLSEVANVEKIVQCYQKLRTMGQKLILVDSTDNKPLFTLRSLIRVLRYCIYFVSNSDKSASVASLVEEGLYDGFRFSFGGMLSDKSKLELERVVSEYFKRKRPSGSRLVEVRDKCVVIGGFKLPKGPLPCENPSDYILTDTVWQNLLNLARVISIGEYALLQGETSVGKTSLIYHLAKLTGNHVSRVNNHLHTDLSEYIGTYCTTESGSEFFFNDGLLVSALRKGSWLILDELNLAPSEVLEALNRLLDDNKELYVPETNEVIKPLPSFRLFGTQNPPGLYGGRKTLSRAFRSRFIELSFPVLPAKELESILCLRVSVPLPPKYAEYLVNVMQALHRRRSKSNVFQGKSGLVTLRDLFRWAGRGPASYEDLVYHGRCLLKEKCRDESDRDHIDLVLNNYKGAKIDNKYIHAMEDKFLTDDLKQAALDCGLVLTKTMKRMLLLILLAFANKEPVLIIGGTGIGKTTAADFVAKYFNSSLIHVSIHQHTDVVDLLGTLKPDPSQKRLFKYEDGPLVKAMIDGEHILLDEISLADDAVLERLNSVLETERSLTVSYTDEKDDVSRLIEAHEDFRIIATMNPSGDYGKKELSPALRNRFTEIWIPEVDDIDDVRLIIQSKLECLGDNAIRVTQVIVDFFSHFSSSTSITLSLRDLLAWVDFIIKNSQIIPVDQCVLHGACLAIIDGLSIRGSMDPLTYQNLSRDLLLFLSQSLITCLNAPSSILDTFTSSLSNILFNETEDSIYFGPFPLTYGTSSSSSSRFILDAPTPYLNSLRIVRALTVARPILVEGPPGAGKTSLVTALGALAKETVVRINFSEHSDMMDLLGSFVPNPSSDDTSADFVWVDGILLTSLKHGFWVILDEINLAPQQVLEGLNSILDHRRSIFIPELNQSFEAHQSFRVFACQNPLSSGGGRRGLPQSFLNRFTSVTVQDLTSNDVCIIMKKSFPILEDCAGKFSHLLSSIRDIAIKFNCFTAPDWPNLRDAFRFCDLVTFMNSTSSFSIAELCIASGFITFGAPLCDQGAKELMAVLESTFESKILSNTDMWASLGLDSDVLLKNSSFLLFSQFRIALSSVVSILMNWPLLLDGPLGSGRSKFFEFLNNFRRSFLTDRYNVFVPENSRSILSLHPGVDVSDLLGSYVQSSPQSELTDFTQSFQSLFSAVIDWATFKQIPLADNFSSISNKLLDLIKNQSITENEPIMSAQTFSCWESLYGYLQSLNLPQLPGITTLSDLNSTAMMLSQSIVSGSRFKWKLGNLAVSVLSGSLLHIQNINLCPSAVLDKLNALFERNGGISHSDIYPNSTSENGLSMVPPNEFFRVVLSMDRSLGSVSPALLNRALVVNFPSLERQEESKNLLDESVFDTFCLSNCYSESSLPVNLYSVLTSIRRIFGQNSLQFEIFIKTFVYKYRETNSWHISSVFVLDNFFSTEQFPDVASTFSELCDVADKQSSFLEFDFSITSPTSVVDDLINSQVASFLTLVLCCELTGQKQSIDDVYISDWLNDLFFISSSCASKKLISLTISYLKVLSVASEGNTLNHLSNYLFHLVSNSSPISCFSTSFHAISPLILKAVSTIRKSNITQFIESKRQLKSLSFVILKYSPTSHSVFSLISSFLWHGYSLH
ncbi:hypothetical protein GEMRC1_008802 [Eukaryota sp. GEM-RC1]